MNITNYFICIQGNITQLTAFFPEEMTDDKTTICM